MSGDPLTGLSEAAAAAQLAADGPNELGAEDRRTLRAIAAEVAREPMFLLLIGAGAIYLATGDIHEAMILLGFVAIIMVVTILQERRTERALDALRDLSSPRALVIRDGQPRRVAGRDVARGDVVMLAEGDRVPADGRVLQAHELAVDESMLTGESEPVAKFPDDGRVYAGTMVVRGQGVMRVDATGARTELGRIGKSLGDITLQASPLRDEIGWLTRRLAVIGAVLCMALAATYWWLRGGWMEGLLAGIALAMGILPQEFPVILIVFLALGARRIAAKRVLTRRLNAIETLGETTVLCVDKTGTLTENRMMVVALVADGRTIEASGSMAARLPAPHRELVEYAVLASETDPKDPMEIAIHRLAKELLADTPRLDQSWSLTNEYELSQGLLAMSHLWRGPDEHDRVVAAKGAPEAIAELCHLHEEACAQLGREVEALASRGLRVLGVARASLASVERIPANQHDFDFSFIGLVALADPLRSTVPGAVAECRRAGIRVVMITGDHPRTAHAIAEAAGIENGLVMTGDDLAKLAPQRFAVKIGAVHVFARVTPEQKLSLVQALKLNGEVVAMTGDGVNDAPALKAAHIGIAMGKRGTDVAREAASLVLLEDDFTAIVEAIRLGRRVFANLRQALIYTLAVHVPMIGLAVLPLLFGMPLVLIPIHIAFLELVIDPACSIVFEAEEAGAGLMERPPRPATEPLMSAGQFLLSLFQGGVVTLLVAACYGWLSSRRMDAEQARALAFIVLVSANAALIFSTRSPQAGLRASLRGLPLVSLGVLGGTIASVMLVTGIEPIAEAFRFRPPGIAWSMTALLVGASLLPVFELVKIAAQRRRRLT